MQSRLRKTLGRRDRLHDGFNFQSARTATASLFSFVDAAGSLGTNASIHWSHHVGTQFLLSTAFTFSRIRTEVTPSFDKRKKVSGLDDANIGGNEQDLADWDPPSLSFAS